MFLTIDTLMVFICGRDTCYRNDFDKDETFDFFIWSKTDVLRRFSFQRKSNRIVLMKSVGSVVNISSPREDRITDEIRPLYS